ncbi:MAG: Rne/Rng family ribonuclease [Alphaproteobacteria bacterium]|jgi:ribonuclease E
MPKRMLIDASHAEETRVVVIDGQRVDEFDYEAATKRPLKGNIYLAKVTRVEPSLQAAFVEYGGNRQGFLAFSEIHPDYYQIPVADRQALIAEQQEEARRRADDEFESVATGTAVASDEELEAEDSDAVDVTAPALDEEAPVTEAEKGSDTETLLNAPAKPLEEVAAADFGATRHDLPVDILADEEFTEGIVDQQAIAEAAAADDDNVDSTLESPEEHAYDSDVVGQQNGDQRRAETESRPAQPLRSQRPPQRWVRRRHYKIQEVIKRKQIMLVQVVKEERGTKGAALTTFMSLAGRYCVLMPNTPRGGGISRKITNVPDRNRLKAAAATLELPDGMGVIIRTAGANRTKLEIKRDYEYLLRLWDQIRELTLQSNAPACVYEEGDIIKRAIRDLYNKDVTEILVEGEGGYKNAKDFMRMLMPSHAKNVKPYRDPIPIFQKHHIEAQLDAMFQPTVTLKSGGYIVINQTEALVSIDVNSGRATREHSIEETAHKTNLEAADEVGRQLRLRDLAGLIVIDFIDMEDARNDRDVEKRLRDAVKNDRARVQIGKISQFGLLEMSRQRLRAGVVASSTIACPHCGGQGIVRSVESTALRVLRALEEEGQRGRTAAVNVRVANEVALYTLNQKRRELARLEADYGMTVTFQPEDNLMAGSFDLERTAQRTEPLQPHKPAISADAALAMSTDMSEPVEEEEEQSAEPVSASTEENGGEQPAAPSGGKKRRRRRRGRGGSTHAPSQETAPHGQVAPDQPEPADANAADADLHPAVLPHPESHNGNVQQQVAGTSGSRRRRRRRRKPHNGVHPSPAAGSPAESEAAREHQHAPAPASPGELRPAPFGELVMPNTPSEPVWSLGSDRAEAAANVSHEPVGQMYYRREETLEEITPANSSVESSAPGKASRKQDPEEAPADHQSPEQPEPAPQRRGWWQRQFGGA